MSILLMTRVRTIVTTPSEQLVLLYLADCGSDDGSRIFPSQRRIAYETGMGLRTVRGILKSLENKGILEAIAYDRGGRGMATEYLMHLEVGIPKPPFDPTPKAADSATFTEKAADSATFTEKAADSATFTEKAADSAQKAADSAQKAAIYDTNAADSAAQPLYNRYREPLGEPSRARTRENLTPDVFDQAAEIWPPIREYLRRIIPTRQRPWLLDAQFFPNLDSVGYVLVAPNEFMRDLMLGNWRNLVEMKAWEISRRRSPVAVMTAGEYQQQIMAHQDAGDGPEREAAEA